MTFNAISRHFFARDQAHISYIIHLSIFYALGLLFLLIGLIAISAHFSDIKNDSQIILHFDFYNGIDVVGEAIVLYKILGLSGAVFALNVCLAYVLFARDKFLSYMLALGTLLFCVLIFTALAVIILNNPGISL